MAIIIIITSLVGIMGTQVNASDLGTFYIDSQYNCKTFQGSSVLINGWIMTSDTTSKMKIYIDGKDTNVDLSKRTKRPDVLSAIKGYGGALANPNPGFEGILDISSYTKGEHTVTYRLEQANGVKIYEENYQVIFDNVAKGTFDIDNPNIYGATPTTKEAELKINGWFMTNDVSATMNIYVDGTKMPTTIKRTPRPDVISAIKGYGDEALNPNPGFETSIDLSGLKQGNHKIT